MLFLISLNLIFYTEPKYYPPESPKAKSLKRVLFLILIGIIGMLAIPILFYLLLALLALSFSLILYLTANIPYILAGFLILFISIILKNGNLKRRAILGDPAAQFMLALRYLKIGQGFENDALAAMWLHRSAEFGYVDAQYLLGVLYENGRGISKDNIKASVWYLLAANQGNKKAQEFHDRLNENMNEDQKILVGHLLEEKSTEYGTGS